MDEVIGFCFGLIAVAMGIMGLFVIFQAILGEKDDRIQQAFRDGFTAGVYKNEERNEEPTAKSNKLSKR